MRAQMDRLTGEASGGGEWKSRCESLDKTHQDLRTQLLRQEKVTGEVKQEATDFLNQMKVLSERSGQSLEREERLVHQVHVLEKELHEWKSRYARVRAQVGTLRASSMANTVPQPDTGAAAKDKAFISEDGLVRDIHVTKFQIAIDELLHSARGSEPDAVLIQVKSVVVAVRNLTLDIGDTQSSKNEAIQQRHRLKMKLSATANNLITAAKNFALSKGLSPVSLLDAAASHVSAAVVELVGFVKVRPTPAGELEEDDQYTPIADSPADYYGNIRSRSSAADGSIYSAMSSPRPSQIPNGQIYATKPAQNGMLTSAQYVPPSKPTNGNHRTTDNRIEDLKASSHPTLSAPQTINPPHIDLSRIPHRHPYPLHPIPRLEHPHRRRTPRHPRSPRRYHIHHIPNHRQNSPRRRQQ